MVPFLDLANHAVDPNADMRVAASGAGGPASSAVFELYALRNIAAGDEVCMSYTGREGYTNQVCLCLRATSSYV